MKKVNFDLVYYCDSYDAIGNGHLSRAVNILNSLLSNSNNKDLKFGITGNFSKSAITFIDEFLDKRVMQINDWKNTKSNLCIIDTMFDPIDETYIDKEFCNRLKGDTKKLVLIEGVLGKFEIPDSVDIFINHIPDIEIIGNIDCKKYIGFNYAPVTIEFVNNSDLHNNKSILVVIGSNEFQNGPELILKTLDEINVLKNNTIHIVVSPHYPEEKIKKIKIDFNRKNIIIHQNVKGLIPFFSKVSSIICTYGNITYESLTFHLPTFVCAYKKFQYQYANYLEEKGLVKNLGYFSSLNHEKLKGVESYAIKQDLSEASKELFSESGIENIVKIIENEIKYV